MLNLIYLISRKPDLHFSQFSDHWLNEHRFGERIPAISRYVQYHAEPDLAGAPKADDATGFAGRPLYDGVAVAWWRSAESLRSSMAGAVVAEAIEDELRFIDHSRSLALLADEYVVREPDAACGIVVFECVRRAERLSRREFVELWRELGESDDGKRGGVVDGGYVQDAVLEEGDARVRELDALGSSDASWDGVGARYFRSGVLATRFYEDALANGRAASISHESTLLFTRRHIVKQPAR